MMVTRSGPAGLTGLAGLLLLASVAALRSSRFSLRELPPGICGFAHYGSAVGSAQRLVETHLSPGVADWNIVVPMPPPCADAQVTGVDMRVCDADAAPDVSMSDVRSARVHRVGSLAGFAAVNVTVYCILPSPPPAPPSPPPVSDLTDSSSTEEISNELNSFVEVSSNEEMSGKSDSIVSVSIEQTTTVTPIPSTTTTLKPTLSTTTTVKLTSSKTLPPILEETTARVELALPTEVVTHPPDKTTRPKGKKPQPIQVTINITPTNQMSTEEDKSQAYNVELPLLSNIEKKNEVMASHSPSFSSVPYVATPPRFAEMPPRKHERHPHRPGRPLHRSPPHAHLLRPAPGALSSPLYAPPFPPRASFPTPPPYPLAPPYPAAPLYRPFGLLDPRLRFLQRRQPLIFFRHF